MTLRAPANPFARTTTPPKNIYESTKQAFLMPIIMPFQLMLEVTIIPLRILEWFINCIFQIVKLIQMMLLGMFAIFALLIAYFVGYPVTKYIFFELWPIPDCLDHQYRALGSNLLELAFTCIIVYLDTLIKQRSMQRSDKIMVYLKKINMFLKLCILSIELVFIYNLVMHAKMLVVTRTPPCVQLCDSNFMQQCVVITPYYISFILRLNALCTVLKRAYKYVIHA